MRETLISNGIDKWKSADQFGLKGKVAVRYEKLRKALLRYSQGLSVAAAAQEAGVCRQELYRILARALKAEEDGTIFGPRALTKNEQVVPIRRNTPGKLELKKAVSGAFEALLNLYPNIRKVLDDLVLRKIHPDHKVPLPQVTFAILFNCFKTACLNAKLKAPLYPFNTANQGRSALRRYWKKLLDAQVLGLQAQAEFVASQLAGKSQACYSAYACVELDGYWLEVDIEIEFSGREPGTVVRIPVKRIWIISLIEQASGSCLGHSLAFGENYAASDVLAAVRNSVLPWKPLTSKSSIAYGPGDGFPSMHPELAYMCFDQLHMDNALAQFSDMTLATLERLYRSMAVFGPVSRPRFRPQVEGSFAILQQAGFGEWSSIRRIPYQVLCHAIDAMLAGYNNSRAPGSTSSRMEVLRDMVAAGTVMNRRVPLKERPALERFDVVDHAVVKQDGGTRVVYWQNARHYGSGLLRVPMDAPVVIEADSKDPREIQITCERSGKDLGMLRVERRWAQQPHDLRVRNWLGNDPALRHIASQGADITLALYKFLGSKAGGAATQRKRAVVAKGFMDAQLHDLMVPSAYQGPQGASQNPSQNPAPSAPSKPSATPQPRRATAGASSKPGAAAPTTVPSATAPSTSDPSTSAPSSTAVVPSAHSPNVFSPNGSSPNAPANPARTPAARPAPPRGLTSTSSAFVLDLLKNIESL